MKEVVLAQIQKIMELNRNKNLVYALDLLKRMLNEPLNYDMKRIPEAPLVEEVVRRLRANEITDVGCVLLDIYLTKAYPVRV